MQIKRGQSGHLGGAKKYKNWERRQDKKKLNYNDVNRK